MHISKVSLVNYRNFQSTKAYFRPGVNTLIGENGSGKTNLFRAMRLLLDETIVGRKHDLEESDFHRGLSNWRGHWIAIILEFADVSNDEPMQSLLLHHAAEESSGCTDRATYSLIFRPKLSVRERLASLEEGDHNGLEAIQKEITIDDYERLLLGKTSIDLTDRKTYKRVVGDFDLVRFPSDEHGSVPAFEQELGTQVPREMALWREFSLAYVPALRNVVSDFNDSRRNPLRTLLTSKSEALQEGSFDQIIQQVRQLNSDIENRTDVQEITQGIHKTFKDTVGETYSPTSMRIQSELPIEAADLFKSLKLYVGEHGDASPRHLQEMSLGGANLVYLSLKLLEFEFQSARQAIANFLLIEEPEAHIHTHTQKTLFDRLSFNNTQIVYSTHSTHISEVSNIERVNVLSREDKAWVALQPSTGLEAPQVQSAQRFLDAVRSNLLFARSVLLVEGDAEEILVPLLVKKVYGISLDEIGISLVNVRSTGFENLANLFHENRLRKRCAILTDLDNPYFDTTPRMDDDESLIKAKERAEASAKAGAERKAKLDAFQEFNEYLTVAYARHTFEVDFADTSEVNRTILSATVDKVYRQSAKRKSVKASLNSSQISECGHAAISLANFAGKGWFALLVGSILDAGDETCGPILPSYILDAIGFAAGSLPSETWVRILEYRLSAWKAAQVVSPEAGKEALKTIEQLRVGDLDIDQALEALGRKAYADIRISGLRDAIVE